MLHLVEDDADTPAHYGAQAAILAQAIGATLLHLAARFDEGRFPDAIQHVTVDGALVPSGLVWSERLSGRPLSIANSAAELVSRAAGAEVVVPVHPGTDGGIAAANALATLAARNCVPVRRYRVVRDGSSTRIVERPDGVHGMARTITQAQQDRFGRWSWDAPRIQPGLEVQRVTAAVGAATALTSTPAAGLRIALIGQAADQRDAYPATLAALADAAEAQSIDLNLICVSPHDLSDANAHEALAAFDGVVLPGGADMKRVPGQIAAAKYAWVSCVPVVGLCLGMQSMATAIARLALHTDEIGLMEAEPHVRIPSFVPIEAAAADACALRVHRLGRQPLEVTPGSRLDAILGAQRYILCNHRYRLNPELAAPMAVAGVHIVARDTSGQIADAIEAPGHPFFIGMQGHPELSSAAAVPHPLLSAFMLAAAARIR
jgi:CTP synthase